MTAANLFQERGIIQEKDEIMVMILSRDDIRAVGDNMYQIGSVELEIIRGSPGLGYKNLETEDAGTASLDEIEHEFGEDVASFFREKLSAEHLH